MYIVGFMGRFHLQRPADHLQSHLLGDLLRHQHITCCPPAGSPAERLQMTCRHLL